MMNVRDLNAAMLTKVGQLIDSIRPYTTPSVNKIQWKTISETVNAWRVQYSAKPFEGGCDSTAKVPGASLAHRLAKEVETVVKLLPIDASIHYKMYPNPASNVVTVNGQNQKLIQKISIYDLMGKLVLEDPTINSFQYEMQISQLPQGTYRLQIFDTSQTVTGIIPK